MFVLPTFITNTKRNITMKSIINKNPAFSQVGLGLLVFNRGLVRRERGL